jgi:hypothetical protein
LIDKFITEEGVFSPETLALWTRKKKWMWCYGWIKN